MTNQAADAERRGFSWKHGISWALYDWGNSAFATVVMAVFFPLFLGRYWIGEGSETNSTFVLGVANSVGSLIIVLLAPVLGSIADRGSSRKRYLMVFAFFGALMTGLLFMVQSGQWMAAVLLYAGGLIGFSGSNIPDPGPEP
ncbi:MAG: MFS transporter [Verrucomicrobiota bacterium]